jgi:DNA-binding NarL/FixJ family response regulator
MAETNPELVQVANQLEDLKRLAILQLVAMGVQSKHIAQTLGIDASTISRMVPVRDVQKAASNQ